MHEYCHRCGGEILSDDSSPFCPHCGSPQLYLQDHEDATGAMEPSTTGELPPPHPQQVEWKTAIRCAALVAGVAAVLSVAAMQVEVLSPLSWVWTISASLTTLVLYQKRRPMAWMDASVGARIGIVAGLVLLASLATAMAAAGLVARYGLHRMGGFDAELTHMLHVQIEKAEATDPGAKAISEYLYSPEFRVGMMLAGFSLLGALLLVLSTVGGAVGGFLRMRRKVAV